MRERGGTIGVGNREQMAIEGRGGREQGWLYNTTWYSIRQLSEYRLVFTSNGVSICYAVNCHLAVCLCVLCQVFYILSLSH